MFGLLDKKREKVILKHSQGVIVPRTEGFVVGDVFSDEKRFKSSRDFKENFFGIKEPARGGAVVYFNTLLRKAKNEAIIDKLGGVEQMLINPSELLFLLEKQRSDVLGARISNGCSSNNHGFLYSLLNYEEPDLRKRIALMKDVNGKIWQVFFGIAFGEDMSIYPHPFEYEGNLGKNFRHDRQMFSRNSIEQH